MDINLLLSAALTGIFCYLGAVDSAPLLGVTGGFYVVGRLLVSVFLTGLAFGDVKAGVLCGLAVQAVFIANLSTGGATNSEITYVSYGGLGLALATTKDPAVAVTLAILIGQTFGLIFHNSKQAFFSFFNNRAQKAAENADGKGIVYNHVIYPQLVIFTIRFLPVTLAIYFGKGMVNWLLNSVPHQITDIIAVLGGVLPALGVAMLMSIVIKQKIQLIFFFAGFVLIAFANLSTLALVFIAALIAYLVYIATSNQQKQPLAATNLGAEIDTSKDDAAYEDEDMF
ncbi:PTS sugar transporter subunit IIC [Enterococcus faecium]|uniref:PTS mannose/fructose/sorbose/N-acetylgalactosamine transporter subunit IIC n=1 Tax=Enterococcus faecium TaxID=1352 RepID=UPI000CF24209|nr:PTS sugar transporter subunit IIC [Enterococcus faecium]PQF06498.1 PTS sugar transporter subunit IIC [Enterococcus faecium]PQF24689.1 PTS sugar transporter subunit IIC [Enterococcus faecium]PQG66017.1 PTS sugar transporter subunit IIC [Enterococcus faecium]